MSSAGGKSSLKRVGWCFVAAAAILSFACREVSLEERIEDVVIKNMHKTQRDTDILFSVDRFTRYDSLLNGELFRVRVLRHPSDFYYVIKKSDSLAFVENLSSEEYKGEMSLLRFLNLRRVNEKRNLQLASELFLRIFTTYLPDSVISSLQDIPGVEIVNDERGEYVVTRQRSRIYLEDTEISEPSLYVAPDSTEIKFYSFRTYTGKAYENTIVIRNTGTSYVERRIVISDLVTPMPMY